MGIIAVKKPPRTEIEQNTIFGTNTAVAGQAFDEMVQSHIQSHPCFSVGLIITLQSFQLISTIDVSEQTLEPSDAKKYPYFDQQVPDTITQDRQNVSVDRPRQRAPMNISNKTEAKATTQDGGKKNKSDMALAAEEAGITKREYFASDVLKFGSKEENKAVFKLLAAFVLAWNHTRQQPQEPLDLTHPNTTSLIREVKADISFAFKTIMLPNGIHFQTQPSSGDFTFYAVRQLGYGQSGACCYAFTPSYAPCVLKFFHLQKHCDDESMLAKAEERLACGKNCMASMGSTL